MSDRFDLSALSKPLGITTPALGEVFIAIHGGFKTWLTKGVEQERWPDGRALIRAVLREQARTHEDAPLEPDVVAALDDDQLEAFAAALLAAGGAAFQPGWIRRDGAASRPRARRRRDTERYDMSAREGETEVMRFHRVARDLAEDQRLRDRELTAQILGPNHAELSAVARHLNEFNRLARQSNLADINRTAFENAKASAVLDATTVSTTRAAVLAILAPDLTAAQKAIQTQAIPGVLAAEKALQTANLLGHFAANRTFAATDRSLINSIGVEVAGLIASNRPVFDAVSQVLTEQSRTIQAALGLIRGPDLSAAARALDGLDIPKTYFEALRRNLHVLNPTAGLAMLAAVHSTVSPQANPYEVLAHVVALRPGYQAAATLGLAGAAPRGVVADLLRAYETEPDPAAPVFGAALRTAHTLDDPQSHVGELEDLRATIRDLQAQVRSEKDPVRRLNLYEIITLIGVLLSILLAGASLYGDHKGRVSDETDRRERTWSDAELQSDKSIARAEAANRDRATRFIAKDGPLRSEPHAQGAILQFVYANQLAIAKDQRDGWVKVEVFSYATEQSVVGWIPARRLKIGP